MERIFKVLIFILVTGAIVGVLIAVNLPRPKFSYYDRTKLSRMIAGLNVDLPYEIGTIGFLDSIYLSEKAIVYSIKVNDDPRIMDVYKNNYQEFKDMLKYTFVEMNGQRNMGTTLAHALEDKGLSICCKVYSANGASEKLYVTGEELTNFVDSCRISPTSAMRKVIDMQLKIANLRLPLDASSERSITTVALNSAVGDIDESCLLQSIECRGEDIHFKYKVYEDDLKNCQETANLQNDMDFMDACVRELAKDKDVHEFMNMIVIAHSNLVFDYEGDKSGRRVTLKIPYTILRNHCKIPSELLSIN